jgi:hypothetical protein
MSENKIYSYDELIDMIEEKYKEQIIEGKLPYYLLLSYDFFKIYKEYHKKLSDDVLYFYNNMEIIVFHDSEKYMEVKGISVR